MTTTLVGTLPTSVVQGLCFLADYQPCWRSASHNVGRARGAAAVDAPGR